MKLKLTFLSVFALVLFASNYIKAQDYLSGDPRWSSNPNSAIYPLGSYNPLPQVKDIYIEQKKEPRTVITPIGTFVVNANIIVLPKSSPQQQTELYLCTNPANPLIMFGGSNATNGFFISDGVYVTTNGGISWFGWDTLHATNLADQRGDPGPVINKDNVFIMTHLTSTSVFGGVTGMGANRSTDMGNSFAPTVPISTDGGGNDKNLAWTDGKSTSPYYGNCYMAFTFLVGVAGNGRLSRTTDGGVTWQPFIVLNSTPSGHFAQGHHGACGPNGEVYVCWTAGIGSSPYTEDFVGLAKSTNGGVTFTANENIFDDNGTRSFSFNGWGIRTNGFPRMAVDNSGGLYNGRVYVVVDQYNLAPAGSDADVVLHYSSDGGTTWSAGVRVNQDALNNGKVQFFPCVAVDDAGGVNVLYYDNRNFPSVGDSCSVFMSRSVDGGVTWTDVEIADHHFRPKPTPGLGGGYMGDYIGISVGSNKVWGFWMDDKTPSANFLAWAGSIDLGPSIQHTPLGNTSQISGTRAVNCVITPAGSPINPAATKLLWSRNNPVMTDSVLMTNTSGNNWTANINMTGDGLYRYYLKTADMLGRTATSPPGAPATTHQFYATVLYTTCKSTYVPIRDFTTSYDSILVPFHATITDVNFRMDTLLHTFDGDVSYWIRSPLGAEVSLAAQRGGGGANYIMTLFDDSAATPISGGSPPFTGTFRPETPLAPFNGQDCFGYWRLRVYDGAATDTGSVRRWCLFIQTTLIIGVSSNNQIPEKFELGQNFPNPFNPSTHINYAIPKQSLVKLVVYDILGREVSVLVNELKQAGRYEVNFDANKYSSGVYFYRLEAGDFVDVKKMVLMK